MLSNFTAKSKEPVTSPVVSANKHAGSVMMVCPEANCQSDLVKEFAYPVSPTDKFGTTM